MPSHATQTRYAEVGTITGLILLAFALRAWVLTSVGLIETDGVRYVAIAKQFQSTGSPFDPLFHPLYPIWIALLQPLIGEYELAGRVISALFGATVIAPVYLMSRTLLGRPVATLTSGLLAIHPALVLSGASVLCEPTYTFFLVLAVWAAWSSLACSRPPLMIAAGGLFALAYLTRPEGALYFGLVLIIAIVQLASVQQVRGRATLKGITGIGGAVLVFLMIAGPYLLYLHETLGYWTLSGKISHVLAQDLGMPVAADQTDLVVLVTHGVAVSKQFLFNAFVWEKYVLPDLFPGALILFLLPGLLAGIRDARWKGREGVLLVSSLPPLATLIFHVESRVFLPTVPFLLPITALGVFAMARWVSPKRTEQAWTAGLALLAVLTVLPFTLRPLIKPNTDSIMYHQAAHWIATTQPADVMVMDRKPYVAYYSGRRFVPLSSESPAELAQAVRDTGARLLILDSRVLGDRPLLMPLLYSLPPAGLKLLWEMDAGEHGRIRIFQVRDRRVRTIRSPEGT